MLFNDDSGRGGRVSPVFKSKMRNRGFTLLEVILAATMTAFIAAIAVAGLRTAADSRRQVREANEAQDALRFCALRIEKDLAGIVRGAGVVFEGAPADKQQGTSPRLRMHIYSTDKARADQPESDRYEVEYGLITNDETGKVFFVRRVCPVVGMETAEETTGGILTVLSESIAGFEVHYFDGTEWMLEWTQTQTLPVLMEVLLVAAGAEETQNPNNVFSRSIWMHFPREGTLTEESMDSAGTVDVSEAAMQGGTAL